jgi:hypothetical protein
MCSLDRTAASRTRRSAAGELWRERGSIRVGGAGMTEFAEAAAPLRREILAHCYRMLRASRQRASGGRSVRDPSDPRAAAPRRTSCPASGLDRLDNLTVRSQLVGDSPFGIRLWCLLSHRRPTFSSSIEQLQADLASKAGVPSGELALQRLASLVDNACRPGRT